MRFILKQIHRENRYSQKKTICLNILWGKQSCCKRYKPVKYHHFICDSLFAIICMFVIQQMNMSVCILYRNPD